MGVVVVVFCGHCRCAISAKSKSVGLVDQVFTSQMPCVE